MIEQIKLLSRQEECRQYLIIRGKLGFGKRSLAIDACTDYTVIRSTNFQMFWLDVHNCNTPEKILVEMQRLKIYMRSNSSLPEPFVGPEGNTQLRITELKKFFQNTFSTDKYRDALLVLCDVANKEVIEAFDFHCKILATSRSESCFDEISKNRKRFVVIDRGLTEQESLDFFEKLRVFDESSRYKMKVREIHKLCDGEPMIISLICNNIVQFNGGNPEERLRSFIRQLKHNKLTDAQMESTIEESLAFLPEVDRNAYQRMVVFPQNVFVPISVLARYWQMNAGETEQLVNRLYRCSLLTVEYHKNPTQESEDTTAFVSMHYIYSSYLKKLYGDDELQDMHWSICKSYDIDTVLQRRREPELFDLPDDGYVHYYIGYHLARSGHTELFPELFLDFGFLEQKLRHTGLPNTCGDLEEYRTSIVANDEGKRRLWKELMQFLPTIEEMVHENNDTSLLQYALNASDTIAKEAKRQAAKFTNRVWFADVGHPSKRRRQMVKLQKRPLHLKFYGPDALIAALDDHSILLSDLSPSYVAEPTLLKEHTAPVHKMAIFGEHYLVSLDTGGTLLVWSLKDTPIYLAKCSDGFQSIRSQDSPPGSEDHGFKMRQFDSRNMNYIKPVCRIVDTNVINCFYIQEEKGYTNGNGHSNGNGHRNGNSGHKITLFYGTQNGVVSCNEWCEKSEQFSSQWTSQIDNIKDIRVLHFIAPFCLVILSATKLRFINMKSTSEIFQAFKFPNQPDPLAIFETKMAKDMMLYLVYKESIMRIQVKEEINSIIQARSVEEVFKVKKGIEIYCCTQSEDGMYLVLGTTNGIVVFDCATNTEWQRNSNGYHIGCIDMCTCDDFNYRYLMISGTENGVPEVVNIYGLPGRRTVVGRTLSNDRSTFSGHNRRLVGENHFEVIRNAEDELKIYAVEAGNIVHMLTSAGKSVEGMADGSLRKITCTGQWAGRFCFGTVDGLFYVARDKEMEFVVHEEMREAIVYIKCIDPVYCVVATETKYVILKWDSPLESIEMKGKIVDCFGVDNDGRMIIIRDYAPVQLIEMKKAWHMRVQYLLETAGNVRITGCEFQGGCLVLLDFNGKFRFFTVDKEKEEFEMKPETKPGTKILIQYRVSAMALSKDTSILALGHESGEIFVSI